MARRTLGPATMQVADAVRRALTAHVDPSRPLLVGCSGGADSLALVAGVVEAVRRDPRPARVLVVDHGLQPGSSDVADRAAARCRDLGLAADVTTVVVDGPGGPEAAARRARHDALTAEATHDGAVVLLGHTLDDQAEQVLLGLARGSGPRSLAGMALLRGDVLRPLLGLRRSTTGACCAELGLEPWEDPTNADPALTRSRVRHRVLPVLEAELGPGVAEALARTAELCRADADALDQQADALPTGERLDCAALAPLTDAVRRRVLRRWLVTRGSDQPAHTHVLAVDALVTGWRGQGPVHVPGVTVRRVDGRLTTG
ncbi:tRNA lysidine(34) synthetase TilS [Auraticoccus monumenti]|uniref:tRNA(Ile)-lysidine synthase n=1 Tax=Auraticoccus monumenti TaxID=675864 RepID=A0A1G6RST8_9ACTN|nr:tRNA lysidine(34) synthetase TilS [Auraticoccus monumenti]SDD07702.1 tRNA(Ile)-lysidine synthase [Auraticoccus monumenti]